MDLQCQEKYFNTEILEKKWQLNHISINLRNIFLKPEFAVELILSMLQSKASL